ncbi:hypothetical protein BJ508DRAFT_150764 [Ascobolus immersus RN42]|uniref:Alpha/beta-hydrolase n=1 Tax=Ascobolus immersus RN42 TaxID=1160509 RepID=A0A3N4I0I4_ASCIM|nr:hypothetical protein BJ508DRAFT_150764 [Ascobolus immersus RN42]
MSRLVLLTALTGLASGVIALDRTPQFHQLHKRLGGTLFDFIPATEETLAWQPCSSNTSHDDDDGLDPTLLCAKLLVPRDYLNASDTLTYAIAMIKKPAAISESSPDWRGPVFFNPGGPGIEAINSFRVNFTMGARLQSFLGPNYSVVSIDPRSVGYSEPVINCEDSVAEFQVGYDRLFASFRSPLTGGIEAMGEQLALYEEYNGKCIRKFNGTDNPLRFVGTAAVARDMLRVSDMMWKDAGRKVPKGLQYWGASYGTTLGQYFATLFPDRVERVVLDAVGDGEEWQTTYDNEVNWVDTLDDVLYTGFSGYCAASKACLLNPHGTETRASINRRIRKILEHIKRQPFVPEGTGKTISFFNLSSFLYANFYSTIRTFPRIALVLSFLEQEVVLANKRVVKIPSEVNRWTEWAIPDQRCEILAGGDMPYTKTGTPSDAFNFIKCSDRTVFEKLELDKMMKVHDKIVRKSEIGTVQTFNVLGCSLFDDPKQYQAVEVVPKVGAKKTKFPIFFTSHTIDPVTPLKNAFNMQKVFPGSGVLEQYSVGHLVLTWPSKCTLKYVLEYFETGKVPKYVGCGVDEGPWGVKGELVKGKGSKGKRWLW